MSEIQISTDLSVPQLDAALTEIWREQRLEGTPPEVRRMNAGTGGALTTVLITFATSAAGTIALDFWRQIILPKLRQRFGVDRIKPVQEMERS